MGELTVVESVTLDGVMQAPGRADEDTRDGFEHGGWAVPYADEVIGRAMGERMGGPGGILLGRRTYEDLFGFWPKQKDNPYTETLNRSLKYVASRSLTEPLPWENSALIGGDAADAVAGIKEEEEHITVIGSGELVGSLIGRRLIDEYLLLIHPLVLGSGRRLFTDGSVASLELQDTLVTTTGVVIATYRPAR
ncbi:MAG TPA: dihydrofolate reductase family protein [Solirubrobacterales bacterium]|jgi:dihydrofolate reductase